MDRPAHIYPQGGCIVEYSVKFNFAKTAALVALIALISLIVSTAVASRAYVERGEQAFSADQVITVKGSTRRRIRSDQAVWSICVRGENKELKEAFNILDEGVNCIRAFLKDQGFSDAEITVSAIGTTEHHARDLKGNETREITAYSLSRSFTITTPNVDRVYRAEGEVTQLIKDGVLVISYSPAYYYRELAGLKVDLMAEAAKDARARAENIAGAAGCKVAEVRSASMGVLQVTQPLSTDVSDYGTYDTDTIDKDVQAVVKVTFRIDKP